jgi:hypothetical protein
MNKNYLVKSLLLVLLISFNIHVAIGQQKTMGSIARHAIINFSDPAIVDFDPHIVNQQMPMPSEAYGQQKSLLNKIRQGKRPGQAIAKETSIVPNPIQIKGRLANPTGTPPDNDIAISNDGKIMSVINSNIRFYDDTLGLIGSKSLASIYASIGTFSFLSDPRVIYDPAADRFVLVCFTGTLSTTSKVLVAFSQSNDPLASWNVYSIDGSPINDSTWSDYPIIAVNNQDFFMSFNLVKDNVHWSVGFRQSIIWQIDKQRGYNGDSLHYQLWSNINFNNRPLRNICPAKYQSNTMPNNMYFLTVRNVAMSNDSIFLTEINNSFQSGSATISTRLLQTDQPYGFPPNVPMSNNNYLQTNDARILAAIYENNYIHYGSNSFNPNYLNAGVMLGQIENVSTASPTIKTTLISNDSCEYAYPSMAYLGGQPADHQVMFSFSHCYTNKMPGTSIVYKNSNNQFSDVVDISKGLTAVNSISDTMERWGDYSGTQIKYNQPDRVFLSNSYGVQSGLKTWVAEVRSTDFTAINNLKTNTNITDVKLYPNPIEQNNQLAVSFYLEKADDLTFIITNMIGSQQYFVAQDRIKGGFNDFKFSTTPLSSGTYLLSIYNKNGNIINSKKFVKQ